MTVATSDRPEFVSGIRRLRPDDHFVMPAGNIADLTRLAALFAKAMRDYAALVRATPALI